MANCQRCSQPLRLDASLSPLGQSAYDMVASSLPEHAQASAASTSSALSRLPPALQTAYLNRNAPSGQRKVVGAPPGRQPSISSTPSARTWGSAGSAESFVLLSESQIRPSPASSAAAANEKGKAVDHEPRSLSKDLARTHALFDLVSAHSDIDHPLCTECGAVLAALMDRQLADAKRERERYLTYERELASKGKSADAERARLEADIKRLEVDEAQSIRELKKAEAERVKLDEELKALEEEETALAAEEEQCVCLDP